MFTGLGQYETGAVYETPPSLVSYEEHGQAERAAAIAEAGESFQPTVVGAAPTTIASGFLPILQNVVSGAANVLGSYLKMTGAKEQAKVPVAAATKTVITPTTGIRAAGLNLGGNLPILGILAIGTFLVLRKGKGVPEKKKRRS